MSRCCGECEFSKYGREEREYFCECEESEIYGLPTMYRGSCDEFVERD